MLINTLHSINHEMQYLEVSVEKLLAVSTMFVQKSLLIIKALRQGSTHHVKFIRLTSFPGFPVLPLFPSRPGWPVGPEGPCGQRATHFTDSYA